MQHWVLSIGAWLLAALLPAPAAADGVYFPPVGVPVPPAIPSQSACIVAGDGEETLIVQSTAGGTEGGELAWLLPLPAPPTRIDKASPGLLESLAFHYGPEIRTVPDIPAGGTVMLLVLSMLLSVWIVTRQQKAMELFLVVLIIAGLAAIATPNWLGPGDVVAPRLGDGVVLARQHVGNYEMVVLRPGTAAELETWLSRRGFAPPPPGAAEIVEEYLAEGWVFVVARLQKQAGALLTPHPVSLTFPAAELVYPMRLTSAAGSDTTVDLFVVGSHACFHPALETWLRAAFNEETWSDGRVAVRSAEPALKGLGIVDYPSLTALFPNRFWLTRLHGTMTPEAMQAGDIILQEGASVPHRKVFHTPGAARGSFSALLFLLLSAGLPIVALVCRTSDNSLRAGRFLLLLTLLVSTCGVVSGVRAAGLDVMDNVQVVDGARMWRTQRYGGHLLKEAEAADASLRKDPERLRQWLEANATNPITGEPIREAESPGNFTLRQRADDSWELVTYPYHLGLRSDPL